MTTLPVKDDFPDELTITIEEGDIDRKCRGIAGSCPIAKAATRALGNPGTHYVLVSAGKIGVYTHKNEQDAHYVTTGRLDQFMREFDQDNIVPALPLTQTVHRLR